VKKIGTKTLAQDVFDRRWSKDTDQNINSKSLTLLIFAVGWVMGIVWSIRSQPGHESMMPLRSLSSLNVLTH